MVVSLRFQVCVVEHIICPQRKFRFGFRSRFVCHISLNDNGRRPFLNLYMNLSWERVISSFNGKIFKFLNRGVVWALYCELVIARMGLKRKLN